jgi:hypothetical protein
MENILHRLVNHFSIPATATLHDERMGLLYDDEVTLDWREVSKNLHWTSDGHLDRRFK